MYKTIFKLSISLLFGLYSCSENKTVKNMVDRIEDKNKTISQTNWSGEWIFEKKSAQADVPEEQFTLTIIQEGNWIKAQYCAIANSGGKIDCESTKEYNVSGKIRDGRITGEFFSFFDPSGNKGKFEISSVDGDKIQWKIVSPPKGFFYAPDRCILIRKTGSKIQNVKQ